MFHVACYKDLTFVHNVLSFLDETTSPPGVNHLNLEAFYEVRILEKRINTEKNQDISRTVS